MKKTGVYLILVTSLFCMSRLGYATSVFYETTNLGANRWEYNYSVTNDTLGSAIDEFTLFFDYGLYENLTVTTPVAGWDELTFDPALIFGSPEPGIYDALALGVGIAQGETISGFSVSFDWLGAGIPGSQYFEVVDATTWELLDSGVASVVPIPSAMILMASGLLGFFGLSRGLAAQRRNQNNLMH